MYRAMLVASCLNTSQPRQEPPGKARRERGDTHQQQRPGRVVGENSKGDKEHRAPEELVGRGLVLARPRPTTCPNLPWCGVKCRANILLSRGLHHVDVSVYGCVCLSPLLC